MSSDLAIEVRNLSKAYHIYSSPSMRLKQFILPSLNRLIGRPAVPYFRDFLAVNGVSFEVKKGESVGIIGKNGSGKSTLLQLICGTLQPTSGEINTQGRIAALLELGSGFNPEFTGVENVYLNGAILGLTRSEVEEKFDDIASFADIGSFINQPVKTYSSGMMVRLAFAVQVLVRPDILIVDEALAVGDALFQKRCFQRIESLRNDGTTILFVSHDIESVRTLTNRALLLRNGEVAAWGVTSDVILDYRRMLHNDEAEYFRNLVHLHSKNNRGSLSSERLKEDSASDGKSFGDGGIENLSISILNGQGDEQAMFRPGEPVIVRMRCKARRDLSHLNLGLRIRNKEGVKIYSWGTLNQDMAKLSQGVGVGETFWGKSFSKEDTIKADLKFNCDLGTNLYEIQVSISEEPTPDYFNQRMLLWKDEAAFFSVQVQRPENFFGGVVDLGMEACWDG